MKIRNLLILGLVLVGFSYCSNSDDFTNKTDEEAGIGPQMQLVVNMPTGINSRSTTPVTDTEVGSADENEAKTVLLSVFDEAGNFVANYRPTLQPATGVNPVSYISNIFEANALKIGNSYKVYVYINPYPEMDLKGQNPNEFFVPWDKVGDTEEARYLSAMNGLTTVQGFFMSNATTVEPIEVLSTATDRLTPFTITANVERALARFDYTAKNATNTYLVGGAGNVSVQLTEYKLLNTSKQFYHLKRVGTSTTEFIQGGAETASNYVIDTDWEAKKMSVTTWNEDQFNNNFYFNLKSDQVTGYKLLGTGTSPAVAQNLAYVIENTIPSENASKKGLATAVVFKGKLVYNQPTYGGGDGVDVYVWNNTFYGTYDKLPAGVRSLVLSYGAIEKENLVKAGVTSYSWDADIEGFPVYYVYYNRHNDNNDPKKTGAMEFAVVRNNVYKLSITGVNLFGHSNDPQIKVPTNADPNPELPQDDIERDNIYMQVTANVLPWTVRTNEIEF